MTTFRQVIPTSHETKIRKTGGLQAFLGARRSWVRGSLGGVEIKKVGPTYSPAGEGSTLAILFGLTGEGSTLAILFGLNFREGEISSSALLMP
jgi:hypothetical protein